MKRRDNKTTIKSIRVPEELLKLVDQYISLESSFYGYRNTFSQIVNQALAYYVHEMIKGYMDLDPKNSRVFTVGSDDPNNKYLNRDHITQYCYDEIRDIYKKVLEYDNRLKDEQYPIDSNFWGYYHFLYHELEEKMQEELKKELMNNTVEDDQNA